LSGVHRCASVDERGARFCIDCGKLLSNSGYERWDKRCGSCSKRRFGEKEREERASIKESFGNRCLVCGYDRCLAALHFHHKHGRQGMWKKLFKKKGSVQLRELKAHPERFVLLCANCHIELEEKIRRGEV